MNLPNALSRIAQDGWNAIKNIDWAGIGKAIIDGIVNGLRWAGSAIKNTLMNLAEGAWKKVKNFFGINSPSTLMRDTIGKMIPEGLAIGITANADSVYDAMDDLSVGTVDAYNPEFGDVGATATIEGTSITDEIRALKDAILGMQVVLDTGATVGGLAPAMDAQLGSFSVYKGRGN